MSVFGLKLESGCTKLLICSNSGADKEIDVIDVSRQCDLKMRLGDFVEYYNSPNRERTLNVISLEFSETRYTTTALFSRLLLLSGKMSEDS